MELQTYVAQVQEQLAAAAALGDEQTKAVATALARAAEPAMRLAILAALSAAGDEITAALLDAPGAPSVSVRLDADEVRVDVSSAAGDAVASPRTDEGDATARISLRLSEALKSEVEAAANREGVSVNTWLVRAASAALSHGWGGWGVSWSGPGGGPGHGGRRGGGGGAHRVTGWING